MEQLLEGLIMLVNQKNYDEKFQQCRLNFVQGMRELRAANTPESSKLRYV